jgi:hypothetical protein
VLIYNINDFGKTRAWAPPIKNFSSRHFDLIFPFDKPDVLAQKLKKRKIASKPRRDLRGIEGKQSSGEKFVLTTVERSDKIRC